MVVRINVSSKFDLVLMYRSRGGQRFLFSKFIELFMGYLNPINTLLSVHIYKQGGLTNALDKTKTLLGTGKVFSKIKLLLFWLL